MFRLLPQRMIAQPGLPALLGGEPQPAPVKLGESFGLYVAALMDRANDNRIGRDFRNRRELSHRWSLFARVATDRFLAAEQPPGAVHRRKHQAQRLTGWRSRAFNDNGIVAHRAADKTALAGECRRRTLAHHPHIAP